MTTFYLIRHAERDTVPDLLPGRAAGVHLTPRGHQQAQAIARRLADVPLAAIYSSPLERAVETAEPLARVKGLPVHPAAAFTEMDFGAWTGKRVRDLEGVPAWRAFNEFRSGTRIPGGEAAPEVQHRLVTELLRLRDRHPEQAIACFSHADPIRMALVYFLGAPIDCFARLDIHVGSITELVLAEWGARIVRMNEIPG